MPVTIGRRELVTALGSVAVWPRVARAQQPKVPTIGALVIGNADPEEFWRVFRQGRRDLGYVQVKTFDVSFDRRKYIATGFPNWPPSWSVSKSI